jgi:hypothetical protein
MSDLRKAAGLAIALVTALMACSPADLADKAGRRGAETVVRPIVDDYLTGPEADIATRCIVGNASAEDTQALLRDVGVYAGSATVDLVFRLAQNPGASACMRAAGLPPLNRVAL